MGPQLNDVSERRNRILLDMVRSTISFTELPLSFWGYPLEIAAKLLNMAPSKIIAKTPYEIWHSKPVSYKYPKIWRSPAYIKRLVGDKLIRDLVYVDSSDIQRKMRDIIFMIPRNKSENTPILRRSIRVSRLPERYDLLLTSQLDNNPKTYEEEMSNIDSGKWFDAMRFEMDSMSSNKLWTLVNPPKSFKPIGCKWIYKQKLGAEGEVTTFNIRLRAKGYTKRPSVEFEETYSSVVMAKSIRIFLAISAYYDYEKWQMDVKTTFLNIFTEEEIYMDPPVGFISTREEQKVCCLHRSIYGLKQAS
ncbi:UNVERIFIED_CONTAM: hypothetical protein Sradi_6205700 [Sesamum radiatum]|uniref:Reverse transcriptase Ty1/copia-type domain-containing protein n=1 Tax=Sesamum radiatum TaxID=300843 RepID=A0AAW2K953_SESRA